MFVESYQIVSYIMTCLDMFLELTCSFRSILLQSNLELNSFESCLLLFRPKSREGSECPPCPHNYNGSAYRDVHVHCISVEQNLPPSLSGVGFTNLSLPPSKKMWTSPPTFPYIPAALHTEMFLYTTLTLHT